MAGHYILAVRLYFALGIEKPAVIKTFAFRKVQPHNLKLLFCVKSAEEKCSFRIVLQTGRGAELGVSLR